MGFYQVTWNMLTWASCLGKTDTNVRLLQLPAPAKLSHVRGITDPARLPRCAGACPRELATPCLLQPVSPPLSPTRRRWSHRPNTFSSSECDIFSLLWFQLPLIIVIDFPNLHEPIFSTDPFAQSRSCLIWSRIRLGFGELLYFISPSSFSLPSHLQMSSFQVWAT